MNINCNEPTVSIDLVKFRLSVAERLGANANQIIRDAGIHADELDVSKSHINVEKECAIWKQIVQKTLRSDIGLLCGQIFPVQAMGVIGFVMMNSPSLLVAIEKLVTYQRMIGDSMGLSIRYRGNEIFIEVDVWCNWKEELKYTEDLVTAAVHSWILNNSINQVLPFKIGIRSKKDSNDNTHEAHFSPTRLDYGVAKTFLAYYKSDLDKPLMCANPELYHSFNLQAQKSLTQYESLDTVSGRIKKILAQNMNGNTLSLEQVAKELAMSTRTLQAKLKEESTTYQSLLDTVRADFSKHYIKNKLASFADIAFLLGYSEVSAFSRSFKKWTGISPSQFQSNQLQRHG